MHGHKHDNYELMLSLRPTTPIGSSRACKLCNHPAHPFASVDFNKSCNNIALPRSGILVEYFRCQRCELLFTDFCDQWSNEDFAKYIYNEGYGEVDPEYTGIRARRAAKEMTVILQGAEHLRFLDYGAGSGVFEAEMRANGFANFESYDPFSQPQRPAGCFDIVTCFEAIEHSPSPRQTLEEILSLVADDGMAYIGQTLHPADITSQRGNWWYMAPRNGHVTTFSCETLHLYAESEGLIFSDFQGTFALTRPHPATIIRDIIARHMPQQRQLVLGAPPAWLGEHAAWYPAEYAGSGPFRWTREPDVCLGLYHTPQGVFRVVLRHLGERDEEFLAASRIRVGNREVKIEVHEDDLFAVFDLPYAAIREISLRTPVPYSDAAIGQGSDLRPVGLAIACVE